MSEDARAAAVLLLGAEPTDEAGQRSTVVALLAIVVLLDQATKWWAWRHVSGALINSGGDLLVGRVVGSWYADTVTGGLLDLLGVGFLSIAVLVLVRRRRSLAVVASAALMIGGWGIPGVERRAGRRVGVPAGDRGPDEDVAARDDDRGRYVSPAHHFVLWYSRTTIASSASTSHRCRVPALAVVRGRGSAVVLVCWLIGRPWSRRVVGLDGDGIVCGVSDRPHSTVASR